MVQTVVPGVAAAASAQLPWGAVARNLTVARGCCWVRAARVAADSRPRRHARRLAISSQQQQQLLLLLLGAREAAAAASEEESAAGWKERRQALLQALLVERLVSARAVARPATARRNAPPRHDWRRPRPPFLLAFLLAKVVPRASRGDPERGVVLLAKNVSTLRRPCRRPHRHHPRRRHSRRQPPRRLRPRPRHRPRPNLRPRPRHRQLHRRLWLQRGALSARASTSVA